jgi:hypothetical protein
MSQRMRPTLPRLFLVQLEIKEPPDGSEVTDGVEIEGKIAIPISGHGVTVIFARAKSNANAAEIRPGRHRSNLQRMRDGCLHETPPIRAHSLWFVTARDHVIPKHLLAHLAHAPHAYDQVRIYLSECFDQRGCGFS